MTQSFKAYMLTFKASLLTLKASLLTTLLIMCTILSANAQSASLTVQTPGQVIQGRNFTVTFRVTNADAQISHAPELKGCTLLYGPAVSTTTRNKQINGKAVSLTENDYIFTFKANEVGSITLPSVAINVGSETLKSPSSIITIVPENGTVNDQAIGSSSEKESDIDGKDLFITVTMSKNPVYEHQPVIATVKAYSKVSIQSLKATRLPSFNGFKCEELPVKDEQYDEYLNGEKYRSSILQRYQLYPQTSGTLTIGSASYNVTIISYEEKNNGMFITKHPVEKQVSISTKPLSVKVLPLPKR